MEKKISFSEILKKYTMVIVLVFVVIMFSVNTKGVMLLPQNVNNLVAQNAYVFILATGMLFCILPVVTSTFLLVQLYVLLLLSVVR